MEADAVQGHAAQYSTVVRGEIVAPMQGTAVVPFLIYKVS